MGGRGAGGVLIDLDGVVWRGSTVLPRVGEALAKLAAHGARFCFFTNNASLTRSALEARLSSAGARAPLVLSSADAVATLIRQGERVAMIGGEGLREALTSAGARIVRGRRAETAVVGLDFKLTYAKVARVCEAVRGGARFVATNADPTYPLEGGRLVPGTGALVAMVREATGVSPLVAGKPSEVAARLVRERFGEVAVVIGDRPATDGAFARSLGAKFVLVGTGVWPTAQAQNEKVADAVAADLLDAWQAVVAKGWI